MPIPAKRAAELCDADLRLASFFGLGCHQVGNAEEGQRLPDREHAPGNRQHHQ